MNAILRISCGFSLALFLVVALPAATLTVQITPPEANAGDTLTLNVSVEDGVVDQVDLPQIDGSRFSSGVSSTTYAFTAGRLVTTNERRYQLVAAKPGDYTIPPFDVTLKGGTVLRSQRLQFHIVAAVPPDNAPAPDNGTDIQPLLNALAARRNASSNTVPAPTVPRDAGGQPENVFMILTPQSTDAYVGEMVALRIDFYIEEEVNADQDSLPTIKGSDFLMNDFAVRGHESRIVLEGRPYECDTFLTAFAAPKSGDFPLAAERDTYWTKSVASGGLDPFGFTHSTNLGHGMITSNQFTMHIHPLPTEGQPQNFTGAVGDFVVAGDAQPAIVKFGEPVTLTFGIRGGGNFDYVKCPVLANDPQWKVYTPTSKTSFINEERTQGAKTFELCVIPQQNGNVKLPQATFSFFDPREKQYVSEPIDLPTIGVTGAMPIPPVPVAASTVATATVPPPPNDDAFAPNRTVLGDLQASMLPIYRAPWFWVVQGALVALPLLALIAFMIRRWLTSGRESAESISHRRTLRQEEHAMTDAVRRDDAMTFFLAARHAVQLQLGARWAVAPESITVGEIRRRDPALAETLAPLFAQADEVLYSGRASANLDLAHWQRVARECLQLQPV